VRFEVPTAVSLKMAVFWVVAPCSLVKFTDVSEVLTVFIIRAMSIALMVVNFYQTARRNNPEYRHLQINSFFNFCFSLQTEELKGTRWEIPLFGYVSTG
jgi:competence protein ComGF